MTHTEYMRAYRLKNKEKLLAYSRSYYQINKHKYDYKKWQREHPEQARLCKLESSRRNKEKRSAYNKQWARNNTGKVTAYAIAYRLAKIHATPRWLSAMQLKEIEEFYVNRPKNYHVDHIVPLKGKNVCGLHVYWNLQYLPASENIKKSNKL